MMPMLENLRSKLRAKPFGRLTGKLSDAWRGVWRGRWRGTWRGRWRGGRRGRWRGTWRGRWRGARRGAWRGARLGTWNFKQKPTGLFKQVLRIPNGLYRARLGMVFGARIILITHTGRRSGKIFQTPVEVLEHDVLTGEYIVCSGTGAKSDWYQNLLAAPPVAVQVRNRVWAPAMRFLDSDEAASRLLHYERNHPALARRLLASMGKAYDGTNTDRRRMVETMPMLAFTDGARAENGTAGEKWATGTATPNWPGDSDPDQR